LEDLDKKKQAKPAWSTEKYLCELHALDFHNKDAVFHFYVETRAIVVSNMPEPILLGHDSDYWYYLVSEDCADIPRDQKDGRGEKLTHDIVEFKPLPTKMATRMSSVRPTKEELRFGFPLGSFNAIPKVRSNVRSGFPTGERIRTPFLVVYNLVDTTVWLVFNPFDEEIFGDYMLEEWPKEQRRVLQEHPPSYLPPTQKRQAAFDVVKIMEPGEIFKLGTHAEYKNRDQIGESEHRLFSEEMMQSAGRKFLISYEAYSEDFEEAVPKRDAEWAS